MLTSICSDSVMAYSLDPPSVADLLGTPGVGERTVTVGRLLKGL